MNDAFVIIGGGQAGAWVARTLRAEGFTGRIVLVGKETHPPYERPPLSKAVLTGEATAASSYLLPPADAETLGVAFRLGVGATGIDRSARTLRCSDGGTLRYDKLFLTMGSRVRALPGLPPSPRLHSLRTLDDAARLRAALARSKHLLVVGGGWIGLEAAAAARASGVAVTVLEAGPRLCSRSLPAVASQFLLDLHRSKGVDICLCASLGRLAVEHDAIRAERDGGPPIEADHALIAIGIVPNDELATAAGLATADGILVDAEGQTSDPDIYAAGDVTRHPNRSAGKPIRLESWANAQNQAIIAARAALGQHPSYDEVPWFWSDQYGVNLQILGFPAQSHAIHARGNPVGGRGSWLGLNADGTAAGAIAINAPRDLRPVRQAMGAGRRPDVGLWTVGAASLLA